MNCQIDSFLKIKNSLFKWSKIINESASSDQTIKKYNDAAENYDQALIYYLTNRN